MTVLVTPLDWGLGHATRLTPIIDYLVERHQVIIAASGRGYFFLKRRYPSLKIIRVPALRLRYWRSRKLFNIGLVFIGIKLMINYLVDRLWLAWAVRHWHIDVVISDNRFGMHVHKASTFFITHQLFPIFPGGLKFIEPLALRLYHGIIRKYDMCLVPDNPEGEAHLTGELSRPPKDIKVKYLGPLSRFYDMKCKGKQDYDIVVIVSGIEPYRQFMIDCLYGILLNKDYKVLIISGRPDKDFEDKDENVHIVSHLEDRELCEYIRGARIIIARAGYSTIMDLVAMQRPAIIIPTPGQTEQEYIANWLDDKRMFQMQEQSFIGLEQWFKMYAVKFGELFYNVYNVVYPTTQRFRQVLNELGL